MRYDICVIGGGIVGLATAHALLRRRPWARLLLLEKEGDLAVHQTGHNSGVIHSGIYYEPGSLKATLCRQGAQLTRAFCDEHDIPTYQTGKLIVATTEAEVCRLVDLDSRAAGNGVDTAWLSAGQICELEPHIRGLAALRVASTAVVDYRSVARAIADDLRRAGAEILNNVEVSLIDERADDVLVVGSGDRTWRTSQLVVCGGLQADRLARAAGLSPGFQIVPFRGEYYLLSPRLDQLITSLIYPVPNPDVPFLGIHLTRMANGSVSVGPNAVLGWAREGYAKHSISASDILTYARWPGFWRMARRNVRVGLKELRDSLWKRAYLVQCQRYCPELTSSDLIGRHAGIRAQAVMSDGSFAHDFLFLRTSRMLHVGNAPSPAATSAFPIGEYIAQHVFAAQ